jgi:gliding motility-associated-like protein
MADEGYDTYLWSTGDNTNVARVFSSGTYEVTATNIYDGISCETSKTVTVIESNIATITTIETEDWTQNDNAISIFVDGQGDYEYSIDGDTYQDQNTFGNLKIGDYTVYVRDKNGCGVNSQDVFLMFYPKFFTPNNDGFHDTWHIYNAHLEPNNKIYIYDRYGKLLKQLNPNSSGWDGTINGELMPTEDYWFVVYRENGKRYRGHFALKR